MKKEAGEKVVRTASPLACGPGCGLMACVKDGVLVKVEPGDFPGTGHVCARGLTYPKLVYHPDRLRYPMKRLGKRGEGKWGRVSWEEALDTIATRFKEMGAKYGSSSVSFVMDMMGILSVDVLLGFLGACQGTFILPAGCGDSAGVCADRVTYGSQWWFGEDYTTNFDKPALCLVWGNNPAETDFFKWRRIRDAKEGGARLGACPRKPPAVFGEGSNVMLVRPLALKMLLLCLGVACAADLRGRHARYANAHP